MNAEEAAAWLRVSAQQLAGKKQTHREGWKVSRLLDETSTAMSGNYGALTSNYHYTAQLVLTPGGDVKKFTKAKGFLGHRSSFVLRIERVDLQAIARHLRSEYGIEVSLPQQTRRTRSTTGR